MLADSVGLALLVVLETPSPAERLSFVLHDVFAVPFDDVAQIMDRTPDSARQLASRARRRVQAAPHLAQPVLVNGEAGALFGPRDKPIASSGSPSAAAASPR